MTTRCSNCSHPNDEGAAFCANCNHFLAWSASPAPGGRSEDEQPAPPPPAATASLAPLARPVPPAGPPTAAPAASPVHDLISAIDESATLAGGRDRPDLTERLNEARARIERKTVTVAVVGEFKRGKSTLVNALIQTAACPVDADIVTAVPTLVRYGERVAVTAYVQHVGDEEATPVPVAPANLRTLVSEGSDDKVSDVRSVEIQLPHRILRSGLRLLDTPGVGGLESVHGQVSLASLNGADGVLFVTDASQELTGPELQFLESAIARCPTVALVVTKTDLHRHWRQIVELDRAHLCAADIDMPVIPVSSFLRLRAAKAPGLNEESGFAPLVQFLARDVVRGSTARAAATIAHDVDFVTSQLAHEAVAERVVLAHPEQGPAVVGRLDQASRRASALTDPAATWQQTLADGVQDLVADIEHDLQARLRGVLREVRDILDRTDPKSTWTDTEAWLRREVAAAGMANRDLLLERARDLADSVAAQFHLEAVELELDLVTRALERRELPSASTFSMPGGRFGSLLVTARTTALVPMMAVGLVGTGISVFLIATAAVVLGTGIGGKLFTDESKRQRSYRQTQAKVAAGKFIDEVAFEMNKETRDALRLTQRQLRNEFNSRARSLQASAVGALTAAQRATALVPEAKPGRSAQLDDESARLVTIQTRLASISAARDQSPPANAETLGAGRG